MAPDAMPDDQTPDAPKARVARRAAFPLKKLVISAVGIAAAVWIWLGSGWRWDVTPHDLADGRPPLALGSWVGRYARLVDHEDEAEQVSGRVMLTRSGDSPAAPFVDATRGRWNGRAVAAVVMLIWGLIHAGASVYVWRQRCVLI